MCQKKKQVHIDGPPYKKSKRGRPNRPEKEKAFHETLKYLEKAEKETLSVRDLRDMMGKKIKHIDANSQVGAFTTKHMKRRLSESYGDRIVFTEIEGCENVIAFRYTVDRILHDVYDSATKTSDEQKESILIAAAKFLCDDFLSKHDNKSHYPSSEELQDLESNLVYLPGSLRLFLTATLGDTKQAQLLVASIGQAIVQNARPRAILAPMQLALGSQIHHLVESKFLVDEISKLGFCLPYHEIQLFEKSAAVYEATDLPNGFSNDYHVIMELIM